MDRGPWRGVEMCREGRRSVGTHRRRAEKRGNMSEEGGKKDIEDDPKSITHNEEATAVWPVPDDIKDMLTCAASTHNDSPFPVFDVNGLPIEPVDYLWVLSGVVIQVHFALLHFFIKGDMKLIFTTSLWEMHML
ncbi:hypothetical protein BKA82DRAFT_4363646 [Pisolithus tinctorius]|nr:hypothetical protein BKA82DRAFT_4363646 [Pisolithus tinctorius]